MSKPKSYKYIPPRPPMWFNLAWTGGFGALAGFLTAQGQFNLMPLYMAVGAVLFAALAFLSITVLKTRVLSGLAGAIAFFLLGLSFFALSYGVLMGIIGWVIGLSLIHI